MDNAADRVAQSADIGKTAVLLWSLTASIIFASWFPIISRRLLPDAAISSLNTIHDAMIVANEPKGRTVRYWPVANTFFTDLLSAMNKAFDGCTVAAVQLLTHEILILHSLHSIPVKS